MVLLQSQSLDYYLSLISVRLQSLDFYSKLPHLAQYLLDDLLLIGTISDGSRAGLRVTLLRREQIQTDDAKEHPNVFAFHHCNLH
jgi:hypothetical protein